MSSKKIISKDKYIELLEMQRQHLEKKVVIAKENLTTLEFAIEDQLEADFDEVEVLALEDGSFSFKIVEKTDD